MFLYLGHLVSMAFVVKLVKQTICTPRTYKQFVAENHVYLAIKNGILEISVVVIIVIVISESRRFKPPPPPPHPAPAQ